MTPIAARPAVYGSGRPAYRRRVEKPHGANGLHGEARQSGRVEILNPRGSEKPQASHFETHAFGRVLENGIPAGFIAQIIGQISQTDRPDAMAATRAYARPQAVQRRFIRFL